MIRIMRGVIRRLRTLGVGGVTRYAARRADALRCLRHFDLAGPLAAADGWLGSDELGIGTRPCGIHIPTTTHALGAFRQILRQHVRAGPEDVFLDYGSGTGKLLLMAATMPFRRVIGVEMSAQLCATAAGIIDPVRSRLRCKNIEIVNRDATAYELPDDVTVLYFYNPFWGDVLATVLQRIADSLRRSPRMLRIVACNPPEFDKAAAACNWLTHTAVLHYPECDFPFHVYKAKGIGTSAAIAAAIAREHPLNVR